MFSSKHINLLTKTDIYKLGHIEQFPLGTTKVYSYLESRGSKEFEGLLFFGLQYIIKEYLMRPVFQEDLDKFIEYYTMALGRKPSQYVTERLQALVDLGYLPIEIKAVPEGTYIGLKNVLVTIVNTHKDFYWLPGYIEVMLLKVWSPTTVATRMLEYRKVAENCWRNTVDEEVLSNCRYSIIDFGTRGNSSEESSEIHSMSFMTCFSGSDCLPVIEPSIMYYGVQLGDPNFMRTSPATEHSVMCAYGEDNEIGAFKRMFEIYTDQPVCIVSDTYNLWKVFTEYLLELKPIIESRDPKNFTAFRPDSGNPVSIVLGNKEAGVESPEFIGCLELLNNVFGHTVNTKG
jgi:nicotinamide phosphoribosyltransferase